MRDEVIEFIGELILRLVEASGGGEVGLVVVIAALALLTLLVVRFARGIRRDPRASPVGGPMGRPPADWEAEALAHERAGEWRDALRSRYRLLLAQLARRGLVDEVPGRTSGEYLTESVASLPAAAADLRAVTRAFERAWYGDAPIDAEQVRGVREAVARVVASGRDARPAATAAAGPAAPP